MDSTKTQKVINVGEGVEKRELSYMVSGNVNQYSHYGKHYGSSSKKKKNLEIEPPYDPAVTLLGIYPKEIGIWKRHLNSHIYCSTNHNSQDMAST